jgi:hypothetical protein
MIDQPHPLLFRSLDVSPALRPPTSTEGPRTIVARPPEKGALAVLYLLSAIFLGSACESPSTAKIPVDVKARFPALNTLSFSIPGTPGPEGSANEIAFKEVEGAKGAMIGLGLLQDYLEHGGEWTKDLTLIIALEGAPRVANQASRYSKGTSRFDVERIGDHALFYLQFDESKRFDPDQAIGESHLLVEGSTVTQAIIGQRATAQAATGLADPHRGYLRFHFNRRPEESNPVHAGAQLDYTLQDEQSTFAFTFFVRSDATEGDPTLGVWLQTNADGSGFLYVSQRKKDSPIYKLLAQYLPEGEMAIWNGEGKLWGCFDGAGQELGNEKNSGPCGGFKTPFPAPPQGWPGLPQGVPKK